MMEAGSENRTKPDTERGKAALEADKAGITNDGPNNEQDKRNGPAAQLFMALIRMYRQHISPWIGPHCRYIPTCSAYALEAISTHGAFKGLLLAIWRLLRCNPFSKGGYDPVPPKREHGK